MSRCIWPRRRSASNHRRPGGRGESDPVGYSQLRPDGRLHVGYNLSLHCDRNDGHDGHSRNCVIHATQTGNTTYSAAPLVSQSFAVKAN